MTSTQRLSETTNHDHLRETFLGDGIFNRDDEVSVNSFLLKAILIDLSDLENGETIEGL